MSFLYLILVFTQEVTDKKDEDIRTVLLIYGSSVMCIEICRPVNPDVDAPSPEQYGEQLLALEREAVKTLQYITGRYVLYTASLKRHSVQL